MKRILFITTLLISAAAISASAWPIQGQQVAYLGGTASQVKAGETGVFDMTNDKDLLFIADGKTLAIPYERISSIEYRQDVAVHLGVAPAIAVGILKKRERKHVFSITFSDASGSRQAAIFEVSKDLPDTLFTVFRAKAPGSCISPRQEVNRPCNQPLH